MKSVLMGAAALAVFTNCAPAAYEVVRKHDNPTSSEPQIIEDLAPEPAPPPPDVAAPEAPKPVEPPPPLPEVEQSEPPWGEPDLGQETQQEPAQCDSITVCSRRDLPKCDKYSAGLYAFVTAGGYKLVCSGGAWREAVQ